MTPWKEFFYFTPTERRGVLVLIALIACVVILTCFIPFGTVSPPTADETFDEEYTAFLASLKERKQVKEAEYTNRFQRRTVTLASFDPNTTDSVGFLDLGLPSWMIKNILRYREKGGTFRQPEAFKKIYGLSEEQYSTLLPYISIGEEFIQKSQQKDTIRLYTKQAKNDSVPVFKYPVGTVLSANLADTTELKKIPGVGSAIARMIVGYRKQLGGFYRIEQLEEIHLRVDVLRPWLSVKSDETERINLNKVSIERLKAHPYFNFYQAKVIVEYRAKRGAWKSLNQLKLFEEFTPQDLERIAPYVCFE